MNNKMKQNHLHLAIFDISVKEYLSFLSEKLKNSDYNQLYLDKVKTMEIERLSYITYANLIAWLEPDSDFAFNKRINKPYLYLSDSYNKNLKKSDYLLLYKILFEPIIKLKERNII